MIEWILLLILIFVLFYSLYLTLIYFKESEGKEEEYYMDKISWKINEINNRLKRFKKKKPRSVRISLEKYRDRYDL